MAKNNNTNKLSISSIWRRITNGAISYFSIGMFKLLDLIPYEKRVRFGGFLMQRILARPMGYRTRIINNLAYIYPEMPIEDAHVLATQVANSVGRCIVELASPQDLMAMAAKAPITGAGAEALIKKTQANRPVILVSGHFGNYDIVRYSMLNRGLKVGGLYREMRQARFNDLYVERISAIGGALFPRTRKGMAKMVRFLKEGNVLALLIDQHMHSGVQLDFMGKPAYTALSAAEMALKYDAVIFPVYAVRQPDGITFEIQIEAPVEHSDARTMTQDLNDSLSAMVTQHKEQWFWVHKRWK
jgi:KDO2-lipid IV(A) lauroyltransferase